MKIKPPLAKQITRSHTTGTGLRINTATPGISPKAQQLSPPPPHLIGRLACFRVPTASGHFWAQPYSTIWCWQASSHHTAPAASPINQAEREKAHAGVHCILHYYRLSKYMPQFGTGNQNFVDSERHTPPKLLKLQHPIDLLCSDSDSDMACFLF